MDINPLDIVIHILNIGVLFAVLYLLVYKPVRKFMKARQERVQNELNAAAEAQTKADALKAAYDQKLAGIDNEARARMSAAAEKGGVEAERILSDAREQANQILAESREQAKRERAHELEAAQEDIRAFSLGVAEHLLGREVSAEDNHMLIDHLFADRVGKEKKA